VALPVPEPAVQTPGTRPGPGGPNARPLAGPVVPLTVSTGAASDALLGAAANRPSTTDPIAMRVLTKGEPIPAPTGRADDFNWPRTNTVATEPTGEGPRTATTPRGGQGAPPPQRTATTSQSTQTPQESETSQQPARRRVRPSTTATGGENPPRPPQGITPYFPRFGR
jgi:hypothetical protein